MIPAMITSRNEIVLSIGFVDSVVQTGEEIILVGDLNFRCDESDNGFK